MFLVNRVVGQKVGRMRKIDSLISQAVKNRPPLTMSALDENMRPFDAMHDLTRKLNTQTKAKEYFALAPHAKPIIDAFVKLDRDFQAAIDPYRQEGVYSQATCDLFNAKIRDMAMEMEYALEPLKKLQEDTKQKQATLVERLHFLHEEKINTLLFEHPEWAEEIRRRIANLEYCDPYEGTPFDE